MASNEENTGLENKIELQTLAEIVYAEPEKTRFYYQNNDFLCMELGGETYYNVKRRRSLPFGATSEYISVQDMDSKEIALIKDLEQFSEEQQALLKKELDKRYFSPTITSIPSIKSKMGYLYFEVETDAGHKSFTLADVSRNIRRINESNRIIVIDVDGNRYFIEDVTRLSAADFKRLEQYLF